MATKMKEVDAVIVGLGWTGGILAKELAEAGLKVVALERGAMRSTANDFAVPIVRDELRFVIRHDLMQNTARDTLTRKVFPAYSKPSCVTTTVCVLARHSRTSRVPGLRDKPGVTTILPLPFSSLVNASSLRWVALLNPP
jgi:choline dehydrogenase-like flavoprotein